MNRDITELLFPYALLPGSPAALVYLNSGRCAMWHASTVMGLTPGDEVLIPSYNCGAEVDPVVQSGLKVSLYRIKSDLSIDFEDLKGRISRNTKAIVVIHYFGFPQDIDAVKRLCEKTGIYLIEDCSHALFSTYQKRRLGSFGDIAFFSLKKLLPLQDGGVLMINNGNLRHSQTVRFPPLLYECTRLARHMLLQIAGLNNRALLLCHKYIAVVFQSPFDNYEIDMNKVDWALSRLSVKSLRKLLREESIEHIVKKRRARFSMLLDALEKSPAAVPVFDNLPAGVCPSLFPVITEERDKMHERLLKRGLLSLKTWRFFYPDMPWREFPFAVFLKNHVLSLPIGHLVNEKDLLQAAKLLRD